MSRSRMKSIAKVGAAVAAVLLTEGPVYADTAADAAADSLGEVVVTAQRRSENSQTVPISITAIDRQQLQEKGIRNLFDVNDVPSMQIRREPGTGSLTISMRGISLGSQNFSQDSAVGVYVNDVYIARANGFDAGFYDLENIQVLRGPQGTLFGRNTPVGAVLINTARPKPEFGGYAEAEAGFGDPSRAFGRFEGALNAPVSDALALRFAGYYVKDNGYGRSTYTDYRFWARNDFGARATALFKPNDRFNALLINDYSSGRDGGPLYSVLIASPGQNYDKVHGGNLAQSLLAAYVADGSNPEENSSFFTNNIKKVFQRWSSTLQMDYDFGNGLSLKSITGYLNLHLYNHGDFSGIPVPNAYNDSIMLQKQFSEEMLLNGSLLDDKLKFVAGLYYFRETGLDGTTSFTASGNFPSAFFNPLSLFGQDIDYRSKSAFANISYTFQQITGSFGTRYTHDNKYVFVNDVFANGSILAKGPGSYRDSRPVFDVKLQWDPTAQMMYYAKFSTGFRAGGLGFRAANNAFAAETAKTYEIGSKTDLSIAQVPTRFDVALYHTDYENFQVPVTLANPIRQPVINAGAARTQGLEAQVTAVPTMHLNISVGLSYVDAKYQDFLLAGINGLTDYSGNELRNAPKFAASINSSYEIPSRVGNWELRGDYTYSSSYENDQLLQGGQFSVFRQPGFGLLGAQFGLKDALGSSVSVFLWGKNLTDREYLTYAYPAVPYAGVYGEPRSFGVRLRVDLDRRQ